MSYFIEDVRNTLKNLFQKHNRGFLSPDEFNDAANYVEKKIIREAFDFINIIKQRKKLGRIGKNDFDKEIYYKEVIRALKKTAPVTSSNGNFTYPEDYSFLNALHFKSSPIIEISDKRRVVTSRSLATPSEYYPVFLEHATHVEVIPDSIEEIVFDYYKIPPQVNWTYDYVSGEATFDPDDDGFVDFIISRNVFDLVVMEMALYSGIQLKQPDVTQVFDREDNKTNQLKMTE